MDPDPLIGLVGPCKSGKTILKQALEQRGYRVRHIAQEHSFAPSMWRDIANPDVLIFLDVSYPLTLKRGLPNWQESEYQEEQRRLAHARQHADLYIHTDALTPDEVLQQVLGLVSKT